MKFKRRHVGIRFPVGTWCWVFVNQIGLLYMLFEALLFKGFVTVVEFLMAKGLATTAVTVLTKSISTFGLSTVMAAIIPAGLIIGGVVWTQDRINNVTKGMAALEKNDYMGAVINFGQLAMSANIKPEFLPDAIHHLLTKLQIDPPVVEDACKIISEMEEPIRKYIRDHS